MKRFTAVAVFAASILVGVFAFGYIANAQQQGTIMTDEHIARIRENCREAQSSLNQLHSSDALLRVNQGRLYEQLSTKLMTPLNSRIALNRLNGGQLVSTTADYESELVQFRAAYQSYEKAMSHTLDINCTNEPVAFYDSVADARKKREKVHESTVKLAALIKSYQSQFEVFASNALKASEK